VVQGVLTLTEQTFDQQAPWIPPSRAHELSGRMLRSRPDDSFTDGAPQLRSVEADGEAQLLEELSSFL
jgi:hypothetical protein